MKHIQKGTINRIQAAGISLVMISALAIGCALPLNGAKAAQNLDSITSESIRQKEKEIEKAKKDKEAIQSKKSDVEAIKKNLVQQKNDLAAYIEEIDGEIATMQYNIMDLEDQILIKEADIEETEAQLEDAKVQEENHYNAMKVRIKMMYEMNEANVLSSLLGSSSLRDLLNRMDYIEAVVSYDKAAMEELRNTRAYIELCEQELELDKEALDESKAGVEEEKANMEALLEEKQKQFEAYKVSIAESQSQIDAYEDKIDGYDDEIALLEKAIEVEKQQILLAQQNGARVFEGGWVFPIASYKYVSSKYGYRIHPVYGTQKFHSGVDLAAPAGTAIYAAASGVVAGAGYNSSMGNYVMINHGSGLFTVYMHASALYVSEGEAVAAGQTIAAVGSTGVSTGNHLHFSVRLNGSYVDPNDYIYFYDR